YIACWTRLVESAGFVWNFYFGSRNEE
ncbi:hypothetical protein A2U01_0030407, partial [Trifolium medium]|nr:hypothetical protein [Trifolium medium]